MRQQVRKPSRVVHVPLAPRHVLHVGRIRQDQHKMSFENVPDRFPVHAGRFHRTCVHPAFSSHSASANNPCVVVGKRRTSRPTFLFVITRRQATTSALCTSRPAHLLCNVFIATSLRRGRHEALAL